MTIADAIRRMTDEELAEYIKGMVVFILEYMVEEFKNDNTTKIVEALRSEVDS